MQEIKSDSPNNSGNLIFLSLFLLLLAFFILLNALSTIEESRTRKVLTSVATTFRSVVDSKAQANILISELGPTPEPYEVLDALEQLWVTAVPITRVERLTRGQLMQLTVPVNELFLGGKPALRADREELFDRMSLLLGLKAKQSVTDAQVVFGIDRYEDVLTTAEGRLTIERVGRIAAAFARHDAPEERIGVGMQEGDAKMLRLRFEIRDASLSQVTFKKEAGE